MMRVNDQKEEFFVDVNILFLHRIYFIFLRIHFIFDNQMLFITSSVLIDDSLDIEIVIHQLLQNLFSGLKEGIIMLVHLFFSTFLNSRRIQLSRNVLNFAAKFCWIRSSASAILSYFFSLFPLLTAFQIRPSFINYKCGNTILPNLRCYCFQSK